MKWALFLFTLIISMSNLSASPVKNHFFGGCKAYGVAYPRYELADYISIDDSIDKAFGKIGKCPRKLIRHLEEGFRIYSLVSYEKNKDRCNYNGPTNSNTKRVRLIYCYFK